MASRDISHASPREQELAELEATTCKSDQVFISVVALLVVGAWVETLLLKVLS